MEPRPASSQTGCHQCRFYDRVFTYGQNARRHERTDCTKSPFRAIKHYDIGLMQFMQGDILKEPIGTDSTGYYDETVNAKDGISAVESVRTKCTLARLSCEIDKLQNKLSLVLNTDDDHATPTKKSKLDIEDETGGEDDHEDSIDENKYEDSDSAKDDADFLIVLKHFNNEYRSTCGVKKAEVGQNTGYLFPEDPNELVNGQGSLVIIKSVAHAPRQPDTVSQVIQAHGYGVEVKTWSVRYASQAEKQAYNTITVTSGFSEALLKFYFQDIPPPQYLRIQNLNGRSYCKAASLANSMSGRITWLKVRCQSLPAANQILSTPASHELPHRFASVYVSTLCAYVIRDSVFRAEQQLHPLRAEAAITVGSNTLSAGDDTGLAKEGCRHQEERTGKSVLYAGGNYSIGKCPFEPRHQGEVHDASESLSRTAVMRMFPLSLPGNTEKKYEIAPHCTMPPVMWEFRSTIKSEFVHSSVPLHTRGRQKANSKYRNRIRLERASQKQSRDTHNAPYDRVKRCRERKINTKASERVNVDGEYSSEQDQHTNATLHNRPLVDNLYDTRACEFLADYSSTQHTERRNTAAGAIKRKSWARCGGEQTRSVYFVSETQASHNSTWRNHSLGERPEKTNRNTFSSRIMIRCRRRVMDSASAPNRRGPWLAPAHRHLDTVPFCDNATPRWTPQFSTYSRKNSLFVGCRFSQDSVVLFHPAKLNKVIRVLNFYDLLSKGRLKGKEDETAVPANENVLHAFHMRKSDRPRNFAHSLENQLEFKLMHISPSFQLDRILLAKPWTKFYPITNQQEKHDRIPCYLVWGKTGASANGQLTEARVHNGLIWLVERSIKKDGVVTERTMALRLRDMYDETLISNEQEKLSKVKTFGRLLTSRREAEEGQKIDGRLISGVGNEDFSPADVCRARSWRKSGSPTRRGRGGVVVRLLASHQGERSSISGGVALGPSYVEIVPDDTAGRRVFSGFSRFPRPRSAALLHTHLASPSSALKISLLRAAQNSPLPSTFTRREAAVAERLARRSTTTVIQTRPSCLAYLQRIFFATGCNSVGYVADVVGKAWTFSGHLQSPPLHFVALAVPRRFLRHPTGWLECQLAEVKRGGYGASPEIRGGGSGRPPRKPADQQRLARYPHEKIRWRPHRIRFAKAGGDCPSASSRVSSAKMFRATVPCGHRIYKNTEVDQLLTTRTPDAYAKRNDDTG
ncbi:hypothetical protein PR048_008706 [Dryococelus australis]|uniref:Uncharacterized protein n=1 Tax=Dryococelus australis TaxID=614101 RepID=A0ABQ9HZN8_9NEOP|nr:hypothetical protein PR048_008706 [Dryococelus australis]